MPSKYDDLSREQLLALLERRDRESQRFGLVWERDEIEHEKSLNADFVVLDTVSDLCVGDKPFHNLLIEGHNFDALRYLLMTMAGQVKCILIDPPYNTGNADFIYNDRFVDKDDRYRHSKWLEMMYQTLTLARDLLREDGVMLVNIGEEEFARLTCLLDDIMPGRKATTFVWRRRSGTSDAKEYFISQDHEYVLCYANSKFTFEGESNENSLYSNPDNDERGEWTSGDLTQSKNRFQRSNGFYPLHNPETDIWYACDPDNCWRFASKTKVKTGQVLRSATIEQIIASKKVLWPKAENTVKYSSLAELKNAILSNSAPRNLRLGNPEIEGDIAFWDAQLMWWVGKTIGYGKPRYKRFKSELKRAEKPLSTWFIPAAMKKKDVETLDLEGIETLTVSYTTEGTSLLQEMLGNKDFPYPKPLSLIQGLIRQATTGDDIIVDFFAGSGTTGHAVLAQNALDEQNRRFVLVSSTEATAKEPQKNVCRDITQKRLKAAIEGYSFTTNRGRKEVAGIEGDFLYTRTRRIPIGKVIRQVDHAQVWLALQLIHASNVRPFDGAHKPQTTELGTGQLVYLPALNENTLEWVSTLETPEEDLTLYTWQVAAVRQRIGNNERIAVLPIPQTLVERFGIRTKKS